MILRVCSVVSHHVSVVRIWVNRVAACLRRLDLQRQRPKNEKQIVYIEQLHLHGHLTVALRELQRRHDKCAITGFRSTSTLQQPSACVQQATHYGPAEVVTSMTLRQLWLQGFVRMSAVEAGYPRSPYALQPHMLHVAREVFHSSQTAGTSACRLQYFAAQGH